MTKVDARKLFKLVIILPIAIVVSFLAYVAHPQISAESEFTSAIGMIIVLTVAYIANSVFLINEQTYIDESNQTVGVLSLLLGYLLSIVVMFTFRMHYGLWYVFVFVTLTTVWVYFISSKDNDSIWRSKFVLAEVGNWRLLEDSSIQMVLIEDPNALTNYKDHQLVIDYDAVISQSWKRILAEQSVEGRPAIHTVELYEKLYGRVPLMQASDSYVRNSFRHSDYLSIKRAIDIVVAVFAVTVLAVPMLVVTLLVRITSSGPALFSQPRVGRNNKIFTLYKFRTMLSDAEIDGPSFAKDNDMRVTKVGRWLRQSRIDEWPQFWNVLRGDMSIVGPRPERPEWVSTFLEEIPYYSLRHTIRPGITGWAQVRQGYASGAKESELKLEHDLYYLKNLCLHLDLTIIFRTVFVLGAGFGAK